jgi:peptidoglycan hydrolase-like protein with peptidoglycan-binding domain
MPHNIIKQGSTGPDVKVAQERLIQRGYSVGSAGADGIFGPITDHAVRDYQTDRKGADTPPPPPPGPYALTWPLVVDGIVGDETWGRLDPPLTEEGSPLHRHVRLLQALLIKSGVAAANPGPVDGQFGPHTKAAVIAFQQWAGIAKDGKVGPITWGKLHS